MTTFPVGHYGEDQALSDAMTAVIDCAHRTEGRDAARAGCEIRSALAPANGFSTPWVPQGPVREALARAMRQVAGDGHPEAARLRAMAAELVGEPVLGTEPAPEPEPAKPKAPGPPPAPPRPPRPPSSP